MRGIKLGEEGDRVIGANVVVADQYAWTISDDGIAKVSALSEYPSQGRAGQGVIAMRLPKTSKEVAAATIGSLTDVVIILNHENKPFDLALKRAQQIPRGNRASGDFLVNGRVAAVVSYQPKVLEPSPEVEGELA
jgi:DNA gyrase subunit A